MTTEDQQHQTQRRERAKLVGFAGLMLVTAWALAQVAGAPRWPAELPRWSQLVATLSGSTLPLELFAFVVIDAAWLLWLWIVASLGLELLLVLAEVAAHGAAWLVSLRAAADRLSVPLVRRAVAAAFAVQILSRGVPVAAAQPLSMSETSLVVKSAGEPADDDSASAGATASGPTYTVRAGDTLWSIAERAYGSGTEYRRLVEANVGRRMADGTLFSAQGVIRPAWELVVPDPVADFVNETDGEDGYTVRPGDTLSVIAGRLLGDQTRWSDLFELNRGSTTPDGRHVLADADMIWPGLRLSLPVAAAPQPAGEPEIDDAAPDEPNSSTDLVAASTASPAPPAAPEASNSAIELPPLLRTPHAFEPVVLEPADAADTPENDSPDLGLQTPPNPASDQLPLVPLAGGGLGLAAAAGLALGARRLRRLRPLPQEPESEVVVEGGFAEAQLAQDFTRGVHGAGFDPVAVLVGQLEAFLHEYNLAGSGVVAVRHGRSATTVTLKASLGEQALLVDLAPVFAHRVQADAEACVSADQDVLLRLTRLRRTRLLPTAEAAPDSACLVPLGVLYDRQVYSAAWNSLGHVLVAGLPGHGADTILTSLVATLTARRSPQEMRLWIIGSPRSLPAPLFDVPHLARTVDPTDDAALRQAASDLRLELERKNAPELVLIVPELNSLGEQAASFELLISAHSTTGARLVAATCCPDQVVASALLSRFGTRMVLRMQEEEASVALLGLADAAFLGGGGRLLLRLDGREPVELYGYQVPAEHLERLVRVMRSAYPAGGPPAPPSPAPRADSSNASVTAADAESSTSEDHPADLREETPPDPPRVEPIRQPAAVHVETPPQPPIQVTCFGGPRVLCAGTQVWPRPPGGEAKPWELLLYLACQPPQGVSSEDAVEALWPEDEADDAPHRFRQLRYRLRRALGEVPGAPENDGICFDRRVLRLDPGVVYSDARDFLAQVRSARVTPGIEAIESLERARALYVGDLLLGPDSRRYAWVDERDESGVTLREHFRRQYHNASVRLAELYASTGEVNASMQLYHELTEIDPGDERLWLALFHLHAARGDRLALVREEQRMRETLSELAGDAPPDDPSFETAREFQRLLAGLHERERQPVTA